MESKGFPKIAGIALRLHQARNSELRFEFPPDEQILESDLPVGCRLFDGAIEFTSIEIRNDIVARASFNNLNASSVLDSSELFNSAYELWRDEISHVDKASGRLLGLFSNTLDILKVAAERIREGARVFDILHLVEAALPHIKELAPSSIIELFVEKYELTKGDLMAGAINGAFESWLETRPSEALELHARVLEDLSEATASLLGNAVIALSKSDYGAAVEIAKSDSVSESFLCAGAGTWALERLLLADPTNGSITNLLVDFIERREGDLRFQAVRAATRTMHVTSSFDAILKLLAEDGDQTVLCQVADAIFLKTQEFTERGIAHYWLKKLTLLKPEFKSAIDNFDFAMSQLLSDARYVNWVLESLTRWVYNHVAEAAIDEFTANLFNNTISKLLSLEASWSRLLTDWLLSADREHPAALAGIFSQLGHNRNTKVFLDKSCLDGLTPEDFLFLARRMLGYVHDRAQLTSMALSMLQSEDAVKRVYPTLWALLVDEIGYDYPKSTIDDCRKAAEEVSSSSDKEFLLKAANTIEQMLEEHNALPSLNELRPPSSLLRLFARGRAKQMSDSFEAANKNSIWRQIATQITIKAGRGTFSYRDASYGSSMELASISHSIELPRREVFDPIGNSIRHLGFRLAKRGEQ